MYHIKCDDYPLFDPRDDALIVESPKVNLEVNTVCEGAFTIHHNHPYFGKLKKLKSVFEVSDDIGVIFRGRMTNNSYDFHNSTFVDLEGAMAYFNDSKVRPYSFPEDWLEDADYITAAESGNVVEFFLNWLINQHNAQCQEFQRFKLGNVTVTDNTGNNYITRSDSSYPSTWEVLKSKLFESNLGGFLCIRYEADGNYIDYLSEFELTNTQEIVFGENLLNLKGDSDATATYSAVIPIGATIETEESKTTVTIASLPDGDITDDIVKEGDMIYSRSAVAEYGFIIAPVKETTWDEVTDANNLLTKSVNFLVTDGVMLTESVEATAADLHFSDEQVQSFRIYRNVKVWSDPHGLNGIYPLPKLGLDLQNPQNTKITVGSTHRTLTDLNESQKNESGQHIESVRNELMDFVSNKTTGIEQKIEGIDGTYFYIKYSPYADGHVMTDVPDDATQYMGTCSTNSSTAPTDYHEYTWCKVRGADGKDGTNGTAGTNGKDGKTQYLHIKYSDDGKTFTANNGEEIGAWIGTLVDFVEADSTNFNAYTWKKFTGDVQVGGRNLLQKSNPEEWLEEWEQKDTAATANIVDGWLQVTQGTPDWYCCFYPPEISTFPAGDLLLSFEAYADRAKTLSATVGSDYHEWNQGIGSVDVTTTPVRFVLPFTLSKEWDHSTIKIATYAAGSFYIRNIKVETGNVATDWTPAPEDIGSSIGTSSEQIYKTMTDQTTSMLNTCEKILFTALESYVETSNYEEFKRTLQTELEVWAGGIGGRVTETESGIQNVNGDLQEKFNTITKYFTFDINGLTIGQVDNPNKVVIDNDQISILVNNIPVQEFKADGTALIPILKITEILNLLGLQITEDATHINCDYLGV